MTFCYAIIFILCVIFVFQIFKGTRKNLRQHNPQNIHQNTDECWDDDYHSRNYDEWENDEFHNCWQKS